MGNMLFNKRVEEDILHIKGQASDKAAHEERRIFPKHMYSGPMNLGDPNYRGLSKLEEDPLITQRLRDVARTVMCAEEHKKFSECAKEAGFGLVYKCQGPKNEMAKCIEKYFYDPEFKELVVEEYLNERSHYRQTGIKTPRYQRGKYVPRDNEADPPLDENGKYRPRKPNGWDEAYKETGPPPWANFKYS